MSNRPPSELIHTSPAPHSVVIQPNGVRSRLYTQPSGGNALVYLKCTTILIRPNCLLKASPVITLCPCIMPSCSSNVSILMQPSIHPLVVRQSIFPISTSTRDTYYSPTIHPPTLRLHKCTTWFFFQRTKMYNLLWKLCQYKVQPV